MPAPDDAAHGYAVRGHRTTSGNLVPGDPHVDLDENQHGGAEPVRVRSERPLASNLDGTHAQAEQGSQHRRLLQEANAPLAVSTVPALLDRVQTIHRFLLAADPKALRRSISWFCGSVARDCTFQAEWVGLAQSTGGASAPGAPATPEVGPCAARVE